MLKYFHLLTIQLIICYIQTLEMGLKKKGIGRMECGRMLEQMLCLARIRGEGNEASQTHLGDFEM